MIKAVIFDMDGVLVDSEPYQFRAFQKVFKPYGVKLTRKNFTGFGKTVLENVTEIAKQNGITADISELVKERQKIYLSLIKGNIKAVKGAENLVKELSSIYPLAIASSSVIKIILLNLDCMKLADKFKVFVGGDMVPNGKPSPDIFLKASELLNVSPDSCLVIEDAENGVKAAKAAGMACIAVPNKYTKNQDFSMADKAVKSLSEISIEQIETISTNNKNDPLNKAVIK